MTDIFEQMAEAVGEDGGAAKHSHMQAAARVLFVDLHKHRARLKMVTQRDDTEVAGFLDYYGKEVLGIDPP